MARSRHLSALLAVLRARFMPMTFLGASKAATRTNHDSIALSLRDALFSGGFRPPISGKDKFATRRDCAWSLIPAHEFAQPRPTSWSPRLLPQPVSGLSGYPALRLLGLFCISFFNVLMLLYTFLFICQDPIINISLEYH